MLREALATPVGALGLAAATTLLAALESAILPWSPFLIAYAAVLPFAALALGDIPLGPIVPAFAGHWQAVALWSAAILAWEIGVMGIGYEKAVSVFHGGRQSARQSPAMAMEALLAEIGRRRRLPEPLVKAWYAFYFLAWAPIAEELFFWGYLYPALRGGLGPFATSLAVAVCFGARHGVHFMFLPRPYPWLAAWAFMITAAGAAFMNGLLFEACGSLWPLMALHLFSNLAMLLLPAPEKAAP